MTRLNQIVAHEKSTKSRAAKDLTAVYHNFQKANLFDGLSRTYKSKDEEHGDKFPTESKMPQLKVKNSLDSASKLLTELFDVVLTKDTANMSAKGSIVVDGQVLLADVPVTYLLFLEKQLVDLHTVMQTVPKLDPTETWAQDTATDLYVTPNTESFKTKKMKRNHEKAPATEKHPAQVEVYDEDVVIGTWTTRKFSGALPAKEVQDTLSRIEKLQKAVKFAREEANTSQVKEMEAGKTLLDFVLNGK